MQLDALLKTPRALPTVPDIAMRLIATFDQEDVDQIKVANDISLEPVLTAKLLARANSAFFGLLRSVGTVREAMQILGLNKVRGLVLASVLEDCYDAIPGVKLDQFWRYSLNTASVARELARTTKVDDNAAYTVGLIHGIGELVMHVGMPEAMAALDERLPLLAVDRAQIEKTHFGYGYPEVGAALLKSWHFPKRFIEAVANQLNPFDGDLYEPLAGVIHLAAWRCRAAELGLGGEHLINTFPDAIGVVLGVDPDALMEDKFGLSPNGKS